MRALLTDSWYFFRNHIGDICRVILPLCVPLVILDALLSSQSSTDSVASFLSLAANFLITPLLSAVLVIQIAAITTSQKPGISQCYKMALKFWLPMMLIGLIELTAITVGLLALIIPGLIAYSRLSFSAFYCIFEKQSALNSAHTSWYQTKACQWVILKGCCLIALLFLLPFLVVNNVLTSAGIWNPVFDMFSDIAFTVFSSWITIFQFRVFTLHQQKAGEAESHS